MNASPDPNHPRRTTAAVRIVTGARLHFGLLDTASPFGGVGVMIDQPATEIDVALANTFFCDEAIRQRATDIAGRVAEFAGVDGLPPCRVTAIRLAPAHNGLGSGTQSSLALAEGMCRVLDIDIDPNDLAVRVAGRGKRSAIGVHGYFGGGLIYEDADEPMPLNPIRSRIELPSDWRVVVMKPNEPTPTVSGTGEVDQFAASVERPGDNKRDCERRSRTKFCPRQRPATSLISPVQSLVTTMPPGCCSPTSKGAPTTAPRSLG